MKESCNRINENAQRAWEATARIISEEISYKEDIISRFKNSSINTPLTLFVPWGVRPEGTFGPYELAALNRVNNYKKLLQTYDIPSTILIMPADVYAIEINGYPQESTVNYFNRVSQEAEALNFTVKPWSVIRSENEDAYNNILRWEANPESLWRTIPKSLWYRDLLAAAYRRTKQQGDQAITKAAFDYLKERIAEARIIESVYKPIKLSMVSPKKDNVVDCDLPRLYILPRGLRFPWIEKGASNE